MKKTRRKQIYKASKLSPYGAKELWRREYCNIFGFNKALVMEQRAANLCFKEWFGEDLV